jgi:hypothetical protein
MSVGAGAAAAGAAAAAAAELMRQEEEEMTGYSDKDLSEGWEFKILRSNNMGAFRKPERLRAVLDEEKRGGWVLVEKFDDYRIRLKRPSGTKVIQGDFADNYDPYRTQVGVSSAQQAFFIGGAVAVGLLFVITIAILAAH